MYHLCKAPCLSPDTTWDSHSTRKSSVNGRVVEILPFALSTPLSSSCLYVSYSVRNLTMKNWAQKRWNCTYVRSPVLQISNNNKKNSLDPRSGSNMSLSCMSRTLTSFSEIPKPGPPIMVPVYWLVHKYRVYRSSRLPLCSCGNSRSYCNHMTRAGVLELGEWKKK